MENLIFYLLKHIVSSPEKISVKEEKNQFGYTNIIVKVAAEDVGKVIGRNGKIIKAIRTLLKVVGLKTGQKVNLILET